MQKAHPYEKLALIYDKLMSHVNYKSWCEYTISLFQYANIKIETVVDISCGTASLLRYFSQNKYLLFGTDLSSPMLLEAKRKLKNYSFICNNITNLALKSEKFDAVLLLYDSLNYLKNYEQMNLLFSEVHRILRIGGIFIFDIITDTLCQRHYKDFEEEEYWGNAGYFRHSYYDSIKRTQQNDFHIKIENDYYFEKHIQYVFEENEIANYLNLNKFEINAKLDDFTFHASDEDSERIHYVCQKLDSKND